jgi:hypothetical protein
MLIHFYSRVNTQGIAGGGNLVGGNENIRGKDK